MDCCAPATSGDGPGVGVHVIGGDLPIPVGSGSGAVGGNKEIVDSLAGAAGGDAEAEPQRGCSSKQTLTDSCQLHACPSSLAGSTSILESRRPGRRTLWAKSVMQAA